MAWPSIEDSTAVKEKIIKKGITNISAAGYPLSRARATAAKREFTPSWEMMTSADKSTLQTYFDENKGAAIVWNHPDTLVDYTVIIMDDELEFSSVDGFVGFWSTSITLMEV